MTEFETKEIKIVVLRDLTVLLRKHKGVWSFPEIFELTEGAPDIKTNTPKVWETFTEEDKHLFILMTAYWVSGDVGQINLENYEWFKNPEEWSWFYWFELPSPLSKEIQSVLDRKMNPFIKMYDPVIKTLSNGIL